MRSQWIILFLPLYPQETAWIKSDIFLQIKKGHLSKMMSIWECIHFFRWKINVNLFSRFISRPCNFRVKLFLSAQHFYFSVLSNDFKCCFQTSPKESTHTGLRGYIFDALWHYIYQVKQSCYFSPKNRNIWREVCCLMRCRLLCYHYTENKGPN